MPARWKVNAATLRFKYVNSSALIPRNSRLIVTVGDQPLAQVRLNPEAPEGEVTVPIPGSLLPEGYTELGFWVVQHYTEEHCEDPFAPELWTWVGLSEAEMLFEVERRPVPLRLSAAADFLFDPRNAFDTRVNLVIPEIRPLYLRAAALAASGIALRYDYRVPLFSLSDRPVAGMDNVLIGLRGELSAAAQAAVSPAASGPTLAVARPVEETPAGGGSPAPPPRHAWVVITAENEAELFKAAQVFAAQSYPLPDSPAAAVAGVQLPELRDHMLARGLEPGKSYTFASLGVGTKEFRSINPPEIEIPLRLPSDLYLSPNKFASLILHMAYDAAMRSDSVLNFKLNGRFIKGVHLDNPRGDHFRAYRLDIPLSTFKPGLNRLGLQAVLTPLHTDHCQLIQTENLRLTIFDDSKFALPQVPYWIKMPQLDLLFQDAFPFGQWPDLRESAFVVAEREWNAAAAAINAAALCAQKIGYPPFGLDWIVGADADALPRKDIFIAGRLASLPPALRQRLPIAGIDPLKLTFPNQVRPTPREAEPVQFWSRIAPDQPEIPRNLEDRSTPAAVRAELAGNFGPGRAALMQLQHPRAPERTLVVLTAAAADELALAGRALWETSVQAGAAGDLVLLNLERPDFAALAHLIGPSYYLGNPGRLPAVQNFINTHPILSLIGVLVLLLIFCALLLGLVRKRRRRRLAPTAG